MNDNNIILFPDQNPIKIIKHNNTFNKKININEEFELNNISIKPSTLTTNITNYINYLVDNNLLPDLPSALNVVYVRDNSFFTLDNNKNNKNNINNVSIEPPEHYLYPACMSITSNTLYLSNDLELDSSLINHSWNKLVKTFNHSKSNSVLNYRDIFNNDNQKVLEYLIGHEFGHFFLQLKNKDKKLLKNNSLIEKCSLNIEEAFSEAFSLHIMCLKNKGIELETSNFENLKKDRINTEKHRLRFFKTNPSNTDILEYQQYFTKNRIDKLLNGYDFPLIYEKIPFKDKNGNLETDINNIYEKCYQLAKGNNKTVIQNVLNNETFKKYHLDELFKLEIKKSLNIINENKSVDEIITLLHKELEGMSFSTKKILGLREKFLNTNLNASNQHKL
jgi:hypothetical protein